MEFPHGHHHHHHHRSGEQYPPPEITTPPFGETPPPPHPLYYGEAAPPPPPRYYGEAAPPPPQVYHASHEPPPFPQPPSSFLNYASEAPPPPPPVSAPYRQHDAVATHHVSYLKQQPLEEYSAVATGTHHSHRHTGHSASGALSELSNRPTFKVFCKAGPGYSLAIINDKVVLARSDPSDESQHWYKDEKYSTKVKDEEGFPCFSLVNKATGLAMKHSVTANHPVQLIPYNPSILDESVLWTEGKDLGDGYRAIRMINNIRLNVDAFHGDKKSGGVHDGTTIGLWQWNKGDNQQWKIIPY